MRFFIPNCVLSSSLVLCCITDSLYSGEFDEAIATWRKRQGQPSVEATWSGTKTIGKGTRPESSIRPEPNSPPFTDQFFPIEVKLLLDRDRFRLDRTDSEWSHMQNALVEREYKCIKTIDRFIVFDNLSGDKPLGWVRKPENQNAEESSLTLAPIFLTFRTDVVKTIGFTSPRRASELDGAIDGRATMCYTQEIGAAKVARIWLCPDMSFAPVHLDNIHASGSGDVTLLEMSIVYRLDNNVYVPERWKSRMNMGRDRVLEATVVSLASIRLGLDFKNDDFQFAFPAGTWVTDTRDGHSQFVVRPDGSEGPRIATSENPTYEDLVQAGQGQSTWKVLAIVALTLGIGILSVYLLRRRTRKTSNA